MDVSGSGPTVASGGCRVSDQTHGGGLGRLKTPHPVLQQETTWGRTRARSGLQAFKTKAFARFADREGLEDAALWEAVRRAREGLIDADLGGGAPGRLVSVAGGVEGFELAVEDCWRSRTWRPSAVETRA